MPTSVTNINIGGTGKNFQTSFKGISPKQTLNNFKDSEQAALRSTLSKTWNTNYQQDTFNNRNRVITPFRAANYLVDYLARVQYNSGGPNVINKTYPGLQTNGGTQWINRDSTGIPATNCNPKFVADGSEYTKFKKQVAMAKNRNDVSNGGYNNAAFVSLMAVRRR